MTLFYVFFLAFPFLKCHFFLRLFWLQYVFSAPEVTELSGCIHSLSSIVISWVVTSITVCVHGQL